MNAVKPKEDAFKNEFEEAQLALLEDELKAIKVKNTEVLERLKNSETANGNLKDKLVQANVIHEKEDIYYLTFEELREVVRTNKPDYQIVSIRKDEYKLYEKLTPPRVITSDGEIIFACMEQKGM